MLTELHCHTIFSKGRKVFVEGIDGPEQMIKQAVANKTDAIAITDHDTMRGYQEAKKHAKKYGIFLIPGEEITTADGHMLAIGIEEMTKSGLSIEETIDKVHSQGGICISSHPFDIERFGLGDKALLCDAIESFNSINLDRISNWKADRFAKKYKFPITAGSDAHSAEMLGNGLNDIIAEKDIDSVIKAIKKGKNTLLKRYAPPAAVRRWSVVRFKYAFSETVSRVNKNYKWPKRELSIAMLNLVRKSPGKIDFALEGLAYIGVGSAVLYSAFREILGF